MAEPRVMLKLGDFSFSIDSAAYSSLEHTLSLSWAELDRLGREGASQYTGRKLATVTLSGVVMAAVAGISQISKLRGEALKATPLLLVAGSGAVLGDWVVTQIKETQSEFLGNGWPQQMTFELALREYGKDATVAAGAVTTEALTGSGAANAADCAATVRAA